ncbi:MAG: phospho-N-acetylmuramoyl-pentapeptide-transferase [Bacteroidetes bacterium]|nr:phospho-N-acetylmuramoyl-pentapeptide-transferase [Bacteroidota bacterium]
MLYYLFEYLDRLDFIGAGVWKYITFRTSMAVILSLLISLVFGKSLIKALQRLQVSETIRDLGLEGENQKKGTPTMGGLIIIGAILIPTILFAKLHNIYIVIMILTTVWLGLIGFLDDYIKVFKKDKGGLAGKSKIIGQVGIGIVVGAALFFNDSVITRKHYTPSQVEMLGLDSSSMEKTIYNGDLMYFVNEKSVKTNIPFLKNHEFDYAKLVKFMGDDYQKYGWIVFILMTIFVVTAVSNGANITDGIDGLAAGTSAIIGLTLGVLAYISGSILFASYLNIMYIPHLGELLVFAGAFVGACIGFLWYNSYPAQVFMGDTGSLTLGGIIAVFAIMIRKELLIPVLCGIFLVENLSVMIQVAYFKYTKKKYGEGRRVFLMSPIHHHFQKKGFHESKIVTRFWIIGILLAVFTIITLKLR